jgi:hypothetical protein
MSSCPSAQVKCCMRRGGVAGNSKKSRVSEQPLNQRVLTLLHTPTWLYSIAITPPDVRPPSRRHRRDIVRRPIGSDAKSSDGNSDLGIIADAFHSSRMIVMACAQNIRFA